MNAHYKVTAVMDEHTCEPCAKGHGTALFTFGDVVSWTRDHCAACTSPDGCRCTLREVSPVDHRELLRKYIAHVHYHESTDYIDRIGGEWYGSPVDFTAEEKAELERLASEEAAPEPATTWSRCSECGWEALNSVPGRIYAHSPGDHCKYGCGDTMQPHPGKRPLASERLG